jgi:hypothetical protein
MVFCSTHIPWVQHVDKELVILLLCIVCLFVVYLVMED